MNLAEREIQNMAEVELSGLSVFSLCANSRFSKLISTDERIQSRYRFYYVSSNERTNEKTKRDILNKAANQTGFQAFIFAFSFPDDDPGVDSGLLSLVSEDVTVIDATDIRMDREALEQYARNIVHYNLAGSKNSPEAEAYIEKAYEALKPWTEKLLSSPVRIYDCAHPEGTVCETLVLFYEQVLREIYRIYYCSPDTMDLDNFFYHTVGSRHFVNDGYYGQRLSQWDVSDPARTPERLFAFVWGDDSAWYDPEYAGEKVVILKKAFDAYLEEHLGKGEKISFKEIFEFLREPPYGLLPNHIGAILMGMFFRTWVNRGLIWSNGFQQDVLDDEHLLAMIGNGIHNQRIHYRNSLVDTIMLPDQKTAVLSDALADIFGLERKPDRFLPELRCEVRFAMEKLPCPILSAKYAEISDADREVIGMLIRFVSLTSDTTGGTGGDDLAGSLNAAFRQDDGLKARIKACLYGNALQEGFSRMLEKNGVDPGSVTTETLGRMCSGYREWKWIWQEESIIQRIRALG